MTAETLIAVMLAAFASGFVVGDGLKALRVRRRPRRWSDSRPERRPW